MKANPDQLAGTRYKVDPPAKTNIHKVSFVDPPVRQRTWFSNYNEEWAAFLAEKSITKSRPGINNADPETLPRVWNSPHA